MSNPWLSVICPVFNGEKFLRTTLDSIASQADQETECLIIEDSSSDASYSIILEYKNKIPNLHIQQVENRNWVTNTNHALSLARGEYVCFLHQDDIWLKNRIKTVYDIIRKLPEIDLIIHPSIFLDEFDKSQGVWRCPLAPYPEVIQPDLLYERLLIQNFISIPGTVIKRKLILDVGKLDEKLWYTADWDLWLKIAACSKAVYFPKPLSGFRVHSNSQTIKRSFDETIFREQLSTVLLRHSKKLHNPGSRNKEILDAASFSIEVNTKFAMQVHGKRINFFNLLFSFLSLGVPGGLRYLRDSRIFERTLARVRANGLFKKHKNIV